MQDTMVTKSKPLIAIDDFPARVNTTQDASFTENEPLITIDDLAAYNEKRLMRKLLIMVIVVNLIVLISIILWT
ncbi:MAG TPA: hypothetical protein VMW72_05980 [Sedimentisphaerales bacterium]|nr:hypothetical protein [Sedimentisphaerales bacterium]